MKNKGIVALSLGIGLAQKHFSERRTMPEFSVTAAGLEGNEEFFKNYGFDTEHFYFGKNGPYVHGKYRKSTVPDITLRYPAGLEPPSGGFTSFS